MLQQCKTFQIQSKKEFLTNEISPNLRCMFSRLSNFVLCYIHPKLAALKIFYSSQKHVIASYTGLPKKNGFKSKLWSFRWFDDKRRKNYDIKLSTFEVNTFNLVQNSIASFKLQRFSCLNWKGFLSIRTYHTIKLIRDLKKNFGKTNSRNDGCESILIFFSSRNEIFNNWRR